MKKIVILICLLFGYSVNANSILENFNTSKIPKLRNACNKGNAKACKEAGFILDMNGKYTLAARYYKKACNKNYAGGCGLLGSLYLNGEGLRQNTQKALKLFKKACKLSDKGSCNQLGILYKEGLGKVRVNIKKATYYYKKACEIGDNESCEIYQSLR